jgi:hypothetical protein
VSRRLHRPQGGGLLARPVEGENLELPPPLPEWLLGDEGLEVGRRRVVAPGVEQGLDPLLLGAGEHLLEPDDDRMDAWGVGQVGEGAAPPQGEGLVVGHHGRIGLGEGGPGPAERLLEVDDVELDGRRVEPVALADPLDGGGICQCPPEVRDVRLQPVAHARRWRLAPDEVDELVLAHDLAGLGRQGCERRPGAGPADLDRHPGAPDLDRPQDPEPRPSTTRHGRSA